MAWGERCLLAELHFGALVTRDAQTRAERVRRLTLIEHLLTPLAVDDAVARTYGHLAHVGSERPSARGRVTDRLVAATAPDTMPCPIPAMRVDLGGIEASLELVPSEWIERP